MRLPHTYIIRCLWAPGSQLQATGAKGLSSARVCVGTSRLVESGAFLPPGIAFSSAWEIRSPLSSFWLFYFTTEVYARNCFLHPTSCLSAGFRGTLCSLPTAGSICGSSRAGTPLPELRTRPGISRRLEGRHQQKKGHAAYIGGKAWGTSPEGLPLHIPFGAKSEGPLPGTWRPETGLRTEAPGSSAPSPSRPPLACCSSPLTRLLPLRPRRLPLPLCSWGREAATTPPPPTRGSDPAASPVLAERVGSTFAKPWEEREPAAAGNRFLCWFSGLSPSRGPAQGPGIPVAP